MKLSKVNAIQLNFAFLFLIVLTLVSNQNVEGAAKKGEAIDSYLDYPSDLVNDEGEAYRSNPSNPFDEYVFAREADAWIAGEKAQRCTDNAFCTGSGKCCYDHSAKRWYCCPEDQLCCPQQTSNGCRRRRCPNEK